MTSLPPDAEHPVTRTMAAHEVNLADAHVEMIGDQPADDSMAWPSTPGGYDADHATAGTIPAHLVPASPQDHSRRTSTIGRVY